MNESHTSGQFRKCKQTQKVQLKPHFNINNKNIPPIVASQMNCCASRNSVNEKFTLPYMVELEKNCFFFFRYLWVRAASFLLANVLNRLSTISGSQKQKKVVHLSSHAHTCERERLSLFPTGVAPEKNKHKNFFFLFFFKTTTRPCLFLLSPPPTTTLFLLNDLFVLFFHQTTKMASSFDESPKATGARRRRGGERKKKQTTLAPLTAARQGANSCKSSKRDSS